ncbi:MAG TPA: hypothetical protein VM621_10340 [Luteibacter sp.]|uniref:hypothetical protein n=1 Tax=Luteibacter sp. TaxID=1886636 RepID=UPI002BD5D9BF|nr:hypothetical protein [Luteibacter sp.]HVI55438.1 hypothetical protein [Luteibacter sp.]
MTNPPTDERRAAFEAWARAHGYDTNTVNQIAGSPYYSPSTSRAWKAWTGALSHQGDESDASADRNFIAGAQWGFARGLENDNASLAEAIEARHRDIAESKKCDVVKVSDLQELVNEWERECYELDGHPAYAGCAIDLTALISKAEKV